MYSRAIVCAFWIAVGLGAQCRVGASETLSEMATPPMSRVEPEPLRSATDQPMAASPLEGADDDQSRRAHVRVQAWRPPLMERRLGRDERHASLSPALVEAISRIEGLYDPTRIGLLGLPLRMKIRAGTASMNNVFADRWHLADRNPNVHYRVRYIAEGWFKPRNWDCADFIKYRTDEGANGATNLSVEDCRKLIHARETSETFVPLPISRASLSLPIFAAPFAGDRLSASAFWAAQQAKVQAIRERLRLRRSTEALSASTK